jgi:hypothetical protein
MKITFDFDYITSIFLQTNKGNSLFVGEASSYTSVSLVSSSQGELNVIFGFEVGLSPEGIKDLFVIRGVVIHKKKSSNIISVEKYDKFLKKTAEIHSAPENTALARAQSLTNSTSMSPPSTKLSTTNTSGKNDEFFTQEFYNRKDDEGEEKEINLDSPLKSGSNRSRKNTLVTNFIFPSEDANNNGSSKAKFQRKRTFSRSVIVPVNPT